MPDGTGKLICSYDYTILNRKICYSDCHISSAWTPIDFGLFNDLRNIPIPFHAGDIVTLDCRPFAPVSHVIILEIGDNRDCCCLQALYREDNGTWDTGAVKHGFVFPGSVRCVGFSVLYRLASFHGQLPEEKCFLEMVSRYINRDEARGRALGRHINRPATEDQIIEYMESNKGDSSI